MFSKAKKSFVITLISVFIILAAVFVYWLVSRSEKTPQSFDNIQAPAITQPVWQENSLVQSLPSHASKTRLSFPVPFDGILLGSEYHFQCFGAHVGDRSEGVEVVALTIQPGTIIKNLADGTVVNVIKGSSYMGCQVQIDYEDGLSGRHHFLKDCLVEKGQKIKAGHPLGEGNAIGNFPPTVEFLLKDENRNDGARSEFGPGSAVSMFDYLKPADQQEFIAL